MVIIFFYIINFSFHSILLFQAGLEFLKQQRLEWHSLSKFKEHSKPVFSLPPLLLSGCEARQY